MKKHLLIMLLLLECSFVNAQNNSEIQIVNETITKFFDGFSTRDIEIIKKHATNDFLLLEDAELWNIDTIASRFNIVKARGISFTRTNSFNFIRTEIRGNTAWVAYDNTATITLGDKQRIIKWLESAVLVKQANKWKIQMMHSTPEKKKE